MPSLDVVLRGRVGPQRASDGEERPLRLDDAGAVLVADLGPKWLEYVKRGYAFIYSSAAAGVTFAANPATNQPTIWNPAGSGVVFVPLRVHIGYVSATNVAGHLNWSYQKSMGSSVGTAAPFSVFTEIAPVPALLGSGNAALCKFATTVTYTAAPTYLRPVGISTAALAATTAVAPFVMSFDEDGGLGVLPGVALTLTANAAVAIVAAVSILGLELPIPNNA